MKAPLVPTNEVRFVCNVCGVRSPQPVLCTRDECLTRETVNVMPPARGATRVLRYI